MTAINVKRIGILTAGGDTPALNATIHGAVVRANQLGVELLGLIKGFNSLFNPRVPHVHLNPLFQTIPELDPTVGGTILGASRDYLNPEDRESLAEITERLRRLKIEGLICVGGDGTLNGMQPLSEGLPTVLAPKTIDNDLGLNYRSDPDEWLRKPAPGRVGYLYERIPSRTVFDHHRLRPFLAKLISNDARYCIDAASRRDRHNEPHQSGWKVLREDWRPNERR